MEINISKFFNEAAPMDYSASVAEVGNNAGPSTWRAACEAVGDFPMLNTADELQAMRDWAKSSGGWDDAEIAAWTDTELNALFIQLISGDIREAELDRDAPDWVQYEKDAEAGRVGGSICRGDDGQIYYYLGD